MAGIETQDLSNSNGTLSTSVNNLPNCENSLSFAVKSKATSIDHCKNPNRRSNRVITYYCLFCSKSFPARFERDKHQATHNASKLFQCDKCSASFRAKIYLIKHKCIKHPKDRDKTKFKDIKPKPKNSSVDKVWRQYQCQVCLKLFASNSNYERHYVGQHSNVKPFGCKECGFRYSYLDSLRTHQKLEDRHVNKGSYPCSYCERIFTNKKCLMQHLDVSHDIKSQSRVCTEFFREKNKTPSKVKNQPVLNSETSTRKYCGKPSDTDNTNHQFNFSDASVNVEKIIEDQQFLFNDEPLDMISMENITNSELEEKPFLCNTCGQCFIIEASLLIHLESHVSRKKRGRPPKKLVNEEVQSNSLTFSSVLDNDIEFAESIDGDRASKLSQNGYVSSNVNPGSTVININTSDKGLDSMQNNLPNDPATNSNIITINITSKGLDKKQCLGVQKYLTSLDNADAPVAETEEEFDNPNLSLMTSFGCNVGPEFTINKFSLSSSCDEKDGDEPIQKISKPDSNSSLHNKENQSSGLIPDMVLETFTEETVNSDVFIETQIQRSPPNVTFDGKGNHHRSQSSSPIKQSVTVKHFNERESSPVKRKRGRPRKDVQSGSSSKEMLATSFEEDDSSLFKVPKLPTINPSMVQQKDFDISSLIDNYAGTNQQQKFYRERFFPSKNNLGRLPPESEATRQSPRQKAKVISYEESIVDDIILEYENEFLSEKKAIIDGKNKKIATVNKSLTYFDPPSMVSTGLPICYVSLQKLSKKEIRIFTKSVTRLGQQINLNAVDDLEEFKTCGHLLADMNINPENPDLKCSYCGQEFTILKLKRSHMTKIHNIVFQCKDCDKTFSGRSNLNRHYVGQHLGNVFSCQYCDKSFNYRDSYNLHMRKYHCETLKIVCNICYRSYTNQRRLDHHKYNSHKIIAPSLLCRLCKQPFKSLSVRIIHEKRLCLYRKLSKKVNFVENIIPSRVLCVREGSNIQESPKPCLSTSILLKSSVGLSNERVLLPNENYEECVEETTVSNSNPSAQDLMIRGDALTCRFCYKKFTKLSGKYIHEKQQSCRNGGSHTYDESFEDNLLSMTNEHATITSVLDVSKSGISYSCRFCKKEFTSINGKYRHEKLKTCLNIRNNYKNNGKGDSKALDNSEINPSIEVSCRFCCENFKTSVDKRKHENLVHSRKQDLIACLFCDMKFRSVVAKSIHETMAHKGNEKSGSKIDVLGRQKIGQAHRTNESDALVMHSPDMKLKFSCKLCGKHFITSQLKNVHEALVHIKKKTTRITKTEATSLSLKKATVPPVKQQLNFACKFCGKEFVDSRRKNVHETLAHIKKKKIKNKKHKTTSSTSKTELFTSDNKQLDFACEFCGKLFETLQRQKVHEARGHSREKRAKSVKPETSSQSATTVSDVFETGLACRFCKNKFNTFKNRYIHERLTHYGDYKNQTKSLNVDVNKKRVLSNGISDKPDLLLRNQTHNLKSTISPGKQGKVLVAYTHDGPVVDYMQDDSPVVDDNPADNPVIKHKQADNTVVEYNQADDPVVEYNSNDGPIVAYNLDIPVVNDTPENILPDNLAPINSSKANLILENSFSCETNVVLNATSEYSPIVNDTAQIYPIVNDTAQIYPIVNETLETFCVVNETVDTFYVVNEIPEIFPFLTKTPEICSVLNETTENSPMVNETTKNNPLVNETTENSPMVNETTENSPMVNETTENSPMVNETTKNNPLVNETTENSPMVNETTENSPMVNETTSNNSMVNETTENSPMVNETTENSLILNETTENSPRVNETTENSPMVNETTENSPMVNETTENSHMVNETTQNSPMVQEKTENSPMVNETTEHSLILNVTTENSPMVNETLETSLSGNDTTEISFVVNQTLNATLVVGENSKTAVVAVPQQTRSQASSVVGVLSPETNSVANKTPLLESLTLVVEPLLASKLSDPKGSEIPTEKIREPNKGQTRDVPGSYRTSQSAEIMKECNDKLLLESQPSEPCIVSKEIPTEFFCKFCKKKFNSLKYKRSHERNVRCMMIIDNLTVSYPTQSLHAKDSHEKIKSCQINSGRDDDINDFDSVSDRNLIHISCTNKTLDEIQQSDSSSNESEQSITAYSCNFSKKDTNQNIDLDNAQQEESFPDGSEHSATGFVCRFCKKKFKSLNSQMWHERNVRCFIFEDILKAPSNAKELSEQSNTDVS